MNSPINTQDEILSKEELMVYQNNSVICVTFSGAFTAATTFFTSLIITQYKSFGPSVNIPTILLIISTFGFLYATLVYSNIGGFLYRKEVVKAKKSMILGTILSEYLGVYFLILSIPLIINVITLDPFLRVTTVLVDMIGLTVYHFSGFSIMERYHKNTHVLYLIIILILELIMVYFQFSNTFVFEATAFCLIVFLAGLAYLSRKERI